MAMSLISRIFARLFRHGKVIELDEMKYLIACLGNIGAEYDNTRHNIGFKIADRLAKDLEASFTTSRLAQVAEMKYRGKTLVVIKPTTYMNLSGRAVKYWLDYEKIPIENLLVVNDDIALPLGTLRMRKQGADGLVHFFVYDRLLRGLPMAKDEVDLTATREIVAEAETQPTEHVGAQLLDDVGQAVVASVGTLLA